LELNRSFWGIEMHTSTRSSEVPELEIAAAERCLREGENERVWFWGGKNKFGAFC
jgi:hypothetical protein